MKADLICAEPWFVNLVTFTIVAAGVVVVGVQTEADSSTPFLDALDGIILAVFTLEVTWQNLEMSFLSWVSLIAGW